MRIHYLQHVHFEDPANIFKWADSNDISINGTKLYKNENLPNLDSFDTLVVMGGPMGVYDEDVYPFLKDEKKFIEKAIKNEKKVLGICLGAQLIADVLGSKVYKNEEKEIGWFPVFLTEEAENSMTFKTLPKKFVAFHWHGDTFDIPNGAKHLAYSEACKNQAFEYNNGKVVGLQFHLETTYDSAKNLIQNSEEELKEKGIFIQSKEEMLKDKKRFTDIEKILFNFLDNFNKV